MIRVYFRAPLSALLIVNGWWLLNFSLVPGGVWERDEMISPRRCPIQTKHIPFVAKWLVALVVVLALLPCVAVCKDKAVPDGQLIQAVKAGQLDKIKALLAKGVDSNAKDDFGQTALMAAARKGNFEIVKLLIEKGADTKARNDAGETAGKKDGSTVLMYAALGGNLDVVKFLIEKGADAKARNDDGWTVLMHAASGGNLDVVKLIIEKGADVNTRNGYGSTALSFAVLGNSEIAKFLIDKGADVNARENDGWTALMDAARRGNSEIVKLLVEKGADVKARGTLHYDRVTAFLVSIRKTIQNRDLSYLERGPGPTALEIATERGHKEIVEYLKAHGAKE